MPSHTPFKSGRRYRSALGQAKTQAEALDRWHSTKPGEARRKLWRVIEGGKAKPDHAASS
jgi:hypothetical protein